jgi:sec-independent protein translocase protein TatC
VYRYFPASVSLFFAGVLFGYFYLVPYAYFYLTKIGIENIRHEPLIEPYLVFLKSLGLGMGIVFQLPILMMGVARAGLIDPANYSKFRGHFIVGAFVIAAVLTPPDPYTMVMMAAPMVVLYEVGILLAKLAVKRAGDAGETALEPRG